MHVFVPHETSRVHSPGLKKSRLTIAIGITVAMIAGCGGGGSDDSDTTDSANETSQASVGAFVDSRVANISYETESGSGDTDSNGQFPYTEGETITFSIGDITLPEIPVKQTITPLDVFSTDEILDIRVINLARYLQTIDEDANPENGILITEGARAAAVGANIDFSSDSFEEDIQPVIDGSGVGDRTLIAEQDARDHLEKTLEELPPEGIYFEIYGMQAGDYENRISGRELIGTSQGGGVFEVADYDRFLLFVPAESDQLFLDAVGFENGSQEWLDSIPGEEYVHRSDDFNPFSADPDCSWEGTCTMTDAGGNTFTVPGENYVEGEPDNYVIASTPGENSYYQYSTFGADFMTLYLSGDPIE